MSKTPQAASATASPRTRPAMFILGATGEGGADFEHGFDTAEEALRLLYCRETSDLGGDAITQMLANAARPELRDVVLAFADRLVKEIAGAKSGNQRRAA